MHWFRDAIPFEAQAGGALDLTGVAGCETVRCTFASGRAWSLALTLPIFAAAALAEIAGCFAFWAVLRLDKSALWLAPGMLCLVLFAWLLTLADSSFAGRAYAAYGGVYIAASIGWLWLVERVAPDRFDMAGAALCLVGAAIILFAPRAA